MEPRGHGAAILALASSRAARRPPPVASGAMGDDLEVRRELRTMRSDLMHGVAWAVRRFGRDFDPQEPETSIQRLSTSFGASMDVVVRRRLGRLLVRARRIIGSPGFETAVRQLAAAHARRGNARAPVDDRAAVVDAILDRAHRQVPFSPLVEFPNLCIGVDPPEGGWPGVPGPAPPPRGRAALVAALAGLRDLRGERKARSLLAGWKDLCETQYADRIVGLTNVVRRGGGRDPVETATIGVALGYARDLRDPLLLRVVDADAALFRNASAHARYRYIPAQDAVSLWDRSAGARVVSVADLEARLERAVSLALEVVPTALRRFVVRRCLISTGVLDALIQERLDLFGADRERAALARDRLGSVFRQAFEPLDRLAAAGV